VTIGDACGAAARDVRERMDRSKRRVDQGQAATREDTYTDDLADAMDEIGEAIRQRIQTAEHGLAAAGSNVHVEFSTEKAPQGEEDSFGLDLGVRLIIETPGYSSEKAILVQCKKMYGSGSSGTFTKLAADGEKQANDILKVSPASFFFLFNAGAPDDLLDMMRSMPLVFPPWEPFYPHPIYRHEAYFDPGVTVLPAVRVRAMSKASKEAGVKLPIGARDVLAGSVPLGHFIATLFSPCFVGDVRKPIVQLAAPPTARGSVSGLDAAVPELGALKAGRFHTLWITKAGSASPEPRRAPRKPKGNPPMPSTPPVPQTG